MITNFPLFLKTSQLFTPLLFENTRNNSDQIEDVAQTSENPNRQQDDTTDKHPAKPEGLELKHWLELTEQSAINPEIAELNFKSLLGTEPYDYLLYSENIARRNDGRVSDWVLRKYSHIENGGWWVNGVDLLNPDRDSLWGQFKPDSPRQDDDGKTIKYEAPLKTATEIFALKIPAAIWKLIARRYDVALPENYQNLPHGDFWQWVIKHPQIPIIIGEGAKKAACVLSCGYVMVSLPGVSNGIRQPKDESGDKIGISSLIPQLQVFAQSGRRIYFCFDQDSKRKTIRNVNQAIARTARVFMTYGCKIKIITWNPVFGKGVDDVIAAHGREQFDDFYRNASDFDKWQTLQLKRLTYRDLVLNQRYLGELTLPSDKQLIGLRSPKNTGKTYLYEYICDPVIRSGEKRVLVITHRVLLATQITQRLGIPFITEVKECGQGSHFGMGLCIDSLHPESQAKFNPDDWKGCWLILDEIMQEIWQLLNSRTCQDKRVAIIKTFKQLLLNVVNYGGKIFIADADLNDIAIDFIKGLIGRDIETWIVENEYKFQEGWKVYQYNGSTPAQMVKNLENKISKGEKHFVCLSGQKAKSKWGSRNLEAHFRNKFPDLRILRIDSETVADPNHIAFGCVSKINEIITDYDLVLATPTIETGVSIDIPHFDGVWGIFQGVQTTDSVRQHLSRYRIPVPRHIWLNPIGINRVGDGSTTVNGLLASEFKKDKANVSRLINSGFEETFNGNFESICLNTWAKMGCLINLGMLNYAKTVINDLEEEGHTIMNVADEEVAQELELPSLEESDCLKKEVYDTCKQEYQAYCESVTNAESLTEEKFEKLSRQQSKTEQERLGYHKGELEKKYKVPVTPELVEKNDKNWNSQIRLDYYFGEGREYLSERDKNVMSNALTNGDGHYFVPDTNSKLLGTKIAALDFLKYKEFLELEEVHNGHPLAQELFAICKQHSYNLKLALGIDFSKDKTPIVTLRRLHEALGFKLPYLRREGSRGQQERIYGKPAPEFLREENSRKLILDSEGRAIPISDEREQVFVAWLARDQSAVEKAVAQKAAASLQSAAKPAVEPEAQPEAIAITQEKSEIELAIEHLQMVQDWSQVKSTQEQLDVAWQILPLSEQKRLEQLYQQWQQEQSGQEQASQAQAIANQEKNVIETVDAEIRTKNPFCNLEQLPAPILWVCRLNRAQIMGKEIAKKLYNLLPSALLNNVWEQLTVGIQDYYVDIFAK